MKKILLYIISFCSVFYNINAQPIKIGEFSSIGQINENQLERFWRGINQMGLSDAQLIKLFTEMGFSRAEYIEMKNLYNKPFVSVKKEISEEMPIVQKKMSDTSIPKLNDNLRNQNIFGLSYFTNEMNTFSPDLTVAYPSSYILGVGDVLEILLTGMNESSQIIKINADGFINIKYAGIVQIAGMSLDKAELIIKNKLSKIYPYINSGKTKLTILISRFKTINVSVLGEAFKPGNYQLPGMATLFNILYLIGGPNDYGSLRRIQIIRKGKLFSEIDFYEFLISGMLKDNITLQDQDVIFFPLYNKRVILSGYAKRPGVYELKENETLKDLFKIAGGFKDIAFQKRIKVYKIGDLQRSISDVDYINFNSYIPSNGDSILIDRIDNFYTNKVSISGSVRVPGDYELTENLTLSSLIEKAGGLEENAFLNRGYIRRIDIDNQKSILGFDLNNIMKKESHDILLKKNDSVFIQNQDVLNQINYIQVIGAVKNEGQYEFKKGTTLEDILLMAGGLTQEADYRKIEVLRQNKELSDSLTDRVFKSYFISVKPDLRISGDQFYLEKNDKVVVNRLLNSSNIGSVIISGEVLYPGNYYLNTRTETVMDIISRSGGITQFGNIAQLKLYRNGVLVGVNLEKTDYHLKKNDSIIIPKFDSLVEIDGAVHNHQYINFNKSSLRYYVNLAGGKSEKAQIKRAYVQYSNGLSRKTKNILFFRFTPKVEPGSKIVIPEGKGTINKLITSNNISAVLSSVTALVSLIVLLKK